MSKRPQRIFFKRLKSGGYRLTRDLWVPTSFTGRRINLGRFGTLFKSGMICVRRRYQWDGASGPVIDRAANMLAGCVHDFLYQCHRAGLLPQSERGRSDDVFRELYVESGGFRIISWVDRFGLWIGGRSAARRRPEVEEQELSAP